jgi:hypothetical protein
MRRDGHLGPARDLASDPGLDGIPHLSTCTTRFHLYYGPKPAILSAKYG